MSTVFTAYPMGGHRTTDTPFAEDAKFSTKQKWFRHDLDTADAGILFASVDMAVWVDGVRCPSFPVQIVPRGCAAIPHEQ